MAPVPGNISPEDFNRYYNGVKDFYEKNLVGRGFNGGILVAKNGRVIFEDYHGYYNLQKKDSLNKPQRFSPGFSFKNIYSNGSFETC